MNQNHFPRCFIHRSHNFHLFFHIPLLICLGGKLFFLTRLHQLGNSRLPEFQKYLSQLCSWTESTVGNLDQIVVTQNATPWLGDVPAFHLIVILLISISCPGLHNSCRREKLKSDRC